jgi:methyltransferase-like protein/cyclopropane fatty-acyl-phospholipid synthase-like methyltransferase
VLELGCADGINLVSMAQTLPGSEFIGIDLSGRQVAEGQAMVRRLGLENVALRQLDILDVDDDFGMFDYIIVYGVYSWVPRPVQEKILAICQERLSPDGVAYVNYNTYPGWHLRGAVREMMLYHTRQFDDAQVRSDQARGLLDFLTGSVPMLTGSMMKDEGYGAALQSEQERLADHSDSYLLHELLEEFNEPVYFHQFMENAAQHGLQYLAEAQFSIMLASNFPPPVRETLSKLGQDIVDTEQYMDFLRNRMFRQTLLCHQDIVLERALGPECLQSLYVASQVLPVSPELDIHSTAVDKFRGPSGVVVSTNNPINKAALLYLSRVWPKAVPFDTLVEEARTTLNGVQAQDAATRAQDIEGVGDAVLKAYAVDLVELHTLPSPFKLEAGARPQASSLARLQIGESNRLTNLRHEMCSLEDELDCRLLPYLDGEHDRADLVSLLADWAAAGTLKVSPDGQGAHTVAQADVLAGVLDSSLSRLAQAALLMA